MPRRPRRATPGGGRRGVPWGRIAGLLAAGAAGGLCWNVVSPRGIFAARPAVVATAPAPAPSPVSPAVRGTVKPPAAKPRPRKVKPVQPSATAIVQVRREAATVRDIGLDEMKKIVAEKKFVIVDARTSEGYRIGHIPGALDLPFLDFAAGYEAVKDRLPRDQWIVVYCTSGDCDEADQVIAGLKGEGFTKILHFKEGWNLWDLSDLPEEKGPMAPGGPR